MAFKVFKIFPRLREESKPPPVPPPRRSPAGRELNGSAAPPVAPPVAPPRPSRIGAALRVVESTAKMRKVDLNIFT